VSCDSANAKHDAPVLQCIVRVPQPRAHGANARLQGNAYHFSKPGTVHNLDVIVNQANELPSRYFYSSIVQRRKVERPVIPANLSAPVRNNPVQELQYIPII